MAAGEPILARTVARYGRYDLLCLDELGYLHLDSHGAELLLASPDRPQGRRPDRGRLQGAVVRVGPDLPPTPRLAAAIVDRLTFNALIIETGSESYWLRATRSRKKGVP